MYEETPFNLLLFTVLVIGLSGCRTSAPKLDYKKLARASVRLGVDIGMEDNHKLYLEAAEWIGTLPGRRRDQTWHRLLGNDLPDL